MKLRVKRVFRGDSYTIGHMYIDEFDNGDYKYFCDTLEDKCRITDGDCSTKVYGETAIPEGTYKFIMPYLNKYRRKVPLLIDVPCFTGILIHAGNTIFHTEGCILVGKNKEKGKVLESKLTVDALTQILNNANQQEFEIEII